MKTYTVIIEEPTIHEYQVEAEDPEAAIEIAHHRYWQKNDPGDEIYQGDVGEGYIVHS